MKILLVGGGSGGPVAPLLAVAEKIKLHHVQAEFLLVGTRSGPERLMAEEANLPFVAISAGKWRRYFSLKNLLTPFQLAAGCWQAWKLMKRFRPDCMFGAGSFVQVPVAWVAWLLGVPVVLHQQDFQPSLANRLCQVPARKITVTFEQSLSDFASGWGLFYKKSKAPKIVWTGNPSRFNLRGLKREEGLKAFGLRNDLPTLLVLGGGTGAGFLNQLIVRCLPELSRVVQIIHSTGPGKSAAPAQPDYHPYEFIKQAELAYAAADIVLCRAGMSTITELSNLQKVSIIVPMPDSHQEQNALFLLRRQAALVVPQSALDEHFLVRIIRKLLFDPKTQALFRQNITGIMPKQAAEKIAEIIETLAISHA